uniref:Uncharacterized protein n=1 Tax=Nicotiana tabacum TaxID=4097 RepID=A0A1S3Z0B2_TOBAC|nr:PREDICTED: uncharacterized protein LOC107781658 [Nicotiana tabacum]
MVGYNRTREKGSGRSFSIFSKNKRGKLPSPFPPNLSPFYFHFGSHLPQFVQLFDSRFQLRGSNEQQPFLPILWLWHEISHCHQGLWSRNQIFIYEGCGVNQVRLFLALRMQVSLWLCYFDSHISLMDMLK